MKKLLLSATALVALTGMVSAADLPSRRAPAPMVAAVPMFTWTGFYVGAQVGYAWGEYEARFSDVDLGEFGGDLDADGFIGGAHAGFNFQTGSLVFGVEGDIEATGFEAEHHYDNLFELGDRAGHKVQVDFQGSIRGRIGFAFDRALIYATGGLAFANFNHEFSYRDSLGFSTYDTDHTEWGYTLGAGVEYAFTNHLTARVEYRYTNFEEGVSFDGTSADVDLDQHAIRAGVSFKF
jgi:outer membrane immunogenic protein